MSISETVSQLIERIGRFQRAADHAHDLNPAQWEVLRYLSRANRYSNTASSVTAYLGSTKGTVSQTLNALERKGLIARTKDKVSARVVRLSLTDKGEAVLGDDPMNSLRSLIDGLPSYKARPVQEGLANILDALVEEKGASFFGVCENCRYARRTRYGAEEPYICDVFAEAVPDEESKKLCAAFLPS